MNGIMNTQILMDLTLAILSIERTISFYFFF